MTLANTIIDQYRLLSRDGFRPYKKCPSLILVCLELGSNNGGPGTELLRRAISELQDCRTYAYSTIKTAASKLSRAEPSKPDCRRARWARSTSVSVEKTQLRQNERTALEEQIRLHSQDQQTLETLLQALLELLQKQLPEHQTAG